MEQYQAKNLIWTYILPLSLWLVLISPNKSIFLNPWLVTPTAERGPKLKNLSRNLYKLENSV